MAPGYGWYYNGSDDYGDANIDWKDYDPDDANADNAGADNFDDNYDADADRYVDAVNNDGCKQQWRKFL